jgi:hypothetical protein
MKIIILVFIVILDISLINAIALSRFFRPIHLKDENQSQEAIKTFALSSRKNANKIRLEIKMKEVEEEKRRTFFVNNLERHLAASAILRDFYSGRF